MIELGKHNKLKVVKIVDFGVYLDGEEWGEVLLPNETVPEGCAVEDEIDVFIYFDSEDRIIATTSTPTICIDEFAYMDIVSLSSIGAFADWGLRKDLLIPFREQRSPLKVGQSAIVYAYLDKNSDRIVGSTKIDKFLDQVPPEYKIGEEVNLMIARKSNLGYNVIINNRHWGLIHHNDIFTRLAIGDKVKGYIKNVREDEKIDVLLQAPGYEKIDPLANTILSRLQEQGGTIHCSDKTDAEEIYAQFACSKKSFKKALGTLYKQGRIIINETDIRLK
ncbi:MAG: CvfB family protein [Marinifilaceae bacterium]